MRGQVIVLPWPPHKRSPIFVANTLFQQVEDMSEVLDRINENGPEQE